MHKTIYTNNKDFGGTFLSEFHHQLKSSDSLIAATGYIGGAVLEDLENDLLKIARRGPCKILIGMVYYEGVTAKQHKILTSLDTKLKGINSESGIFISRRPYHGKIYKFITSPNDEKVYLGSSNFSTEGFSGRLECTSIIQDTKTKDSITKYLDFLYDKSYAIKLEEADLSIKGRKSLSQRSSTLLQDYEIEFSLFPDKNTALGSFDFELRVDDQPASSLNLYFDKGRKNQKGKYAPRPWYEVELQASVKEIRSEFYPPNELKEKDKKSCIGDFIGYLEDDGKYYKIDMKVHSDGGKNISSADSSGGRATLGKFIKGKLEKAGVLEEGQLITSDTLDAYGRNTIKFYKINSNEYILEF